MRRLSRELSSDWEADVIEAQEKSDAMDPKGPATTSAMESDGGCKQRDTSVNVRADVESDCRRLRAVKAKLHPTANWAGSTVDGSQVGLAASLPAHPRTARGAGRLRR